MFHATYGVGVTLAAEDHGVGPAVVLLHAGIADRRMWHAQIPPLVAAGHRVLALDLPGCGDSPVPSAAFELHAPVADTLAALDVGPAVLVGCSFGGRIALDLTLAHPDLVTALVLFGPAIGGQPTGPELNDTFSAANPGLDPSDLDAVAAAEALFWVVGSGRPASTIDPAILRLVETMNRTDLANEEAIDALATALTPPAAERLEDIRVPVTVTTGAHDWPPIKRNCDVLAARVPGAHRLPDIPNAGHLPPLDAPEAATKILLAATTL